MSRGFACALPKNAFASCSLSRRRANKPASVLRNTALHRSCGCFFSLAICALRRNFCSRRNVGTILHRFPKELSDRQLKRFHHSPGLSGVQRFRRFEQWNGSLSHRSAQAPDFKNFFRNQGLVLPSKGSRRVGGLAPEGVFSAAKAEALMRALAFFRRWQPCSSLKGTLEPGFAFRAKGEAGNILLRRLRPFRRQSAEVSPGGVLFLPGTFPLRLLPLKMKRNFSISMHFRQLRFASQT